MNREDKLRHIDNIEKEITSTCFKTCFDNKKLKMDMKCVPICYDKYLFSIN